MQSLVIGEDPCGITEIVTFVQKCSSYICLVGDWKSFARRLHISEVQIDKLHGDKLLDKVTYEDIIVKLLHIWKAKDGSRATLAVLCKAMDECDLGHISESLQNDFVASITAKYTPFGASKELPSVPKVTHEPSPQAIQSRLQYLDLKKDGKHYKSPPEAVKDFLVGGSHDVLLLKCRDGQVTLAWMMDTLKNVRMVDSFNQVQIGSLGVLMMKPNMCLENCIEPVPNEKRKLVILHEQEIPKMPNVINGIQILTGKDNMEWSHLVPSFRTELLQKLKFTSGLHLQPSPQILQGQALIRRLTAEAVESNTPLLAQVVEAHIQEKLEELQLTLDSEQITEDLGRAAIRQAFPGWEQAVFQNTQKYGNVAILNTLSSAKLVSQTFSQMHFDFHFGDECTCLYFLGKFAAQPTTNLAGFSRKLLVLNTISSKVDIAEGEDNENENNTLETFQFQNQAALYFLNFHVNHERGPETMDWGDLRKIAMACVNGNMTNLLRFVVTKTGTFDELLGAAVKYGNKETVEFVLRLFLEEGKDVLEMRVCGSTLLHIALLRGKLDIVLVLLFDFHFTSELSQPHMRNLLHYCLSNSLEKPEACIQDTIEILEILLSLDNTLLEAKSSGLENPPLFSKHMHPTLLATLGRMGANIFATNSYGRTLAHVVSEWCSPQRYHSLLKYLVQDLGHSKLLQMKDADGMTPLQYAVKYMDILPETLRLFENADVGVNEEDARGRSLLFYASQFGRGKPFLKLLLEKGADQKVKDLITKDSTPVFNAAAGGNVELLKYFLAIGVSANIKCGNRSNPLHYVCQSRPKNTLEMVKVLVEAGVNINDVNGSWMTPLDYAVDERSSNNAVDEEVVQLLLQKGARRR